jgi:hypothetical protein
LRSGARSVVDDNVLDPLFEPLATIVMGGVEYSSDWPSVAACISKNFDRIFFTDGENEEEAFVVETSVMPPLGAGVSASWPGRS